MKPTHLILAAIVAVAALLAVVFRYEVTPNGRGGFLKVDRLTGESTFVMGDKEREVRRPPADVFDSSTARPATEEPDGPWKRFQK